ncbi:MAG: ubiquinol-cytochrome C chaperone family protein, partial [Pseudomonadota bacterium]
HAEIVAAARRPLLYTDWGTPDSLDGRYEAIILHAHLVLRRLRRPDGDPALAQALFDVTFKDFELSLREIGVGDQGVPHKIKAMGKGAYGRFEAYDAGLADGAAPEVLAEALRRNYYGTAEPDAAALDALAAYARRVDAAFMADSVIAMEARRPMFPDLTS